jgi:predicted metalloendopeptidase
VKKVVDFYSTLRMENGRMLDAVKTKVENTADICGLTITYQAYCNYLAKHGFTGEQLRLQKKRFFMAYAHLFCSKYTMETLNERMDIDTHSPLPARVNGAVPQMDDWYTLFDVKEGDALYLAPENRVRIW